MWLRLDDRIMESGKLRTLAGGHAGRTRRLILTLMDVWSWAAREGTDGFLPAWVVDKYATERMRPMLTAAVLQYSPLFHSRGEHCRCLMGRQWPEGADYLAHDWLVYNPLRAEVDVKRAQERERKDSELKRAVRDRDGDQCRYCRTACKQYDRKSKAGLTIDHVDPTVASGMRNLVVACKSCNERKGRRTPRAAGLALLPCPAPVGMYDDPTDDFAPEVMGDAINDPISDPTTDRRGVESGRDGTGVGGLALAPAKFVTANGPPPTPRASHRVGSPPIRPAAHPNPFTREALTGPQPEDFAGLPDPEEDDAEDLHDPHRPWPPERDPDEAEGWS